MQNYVAFSNEVMTRAIAAHKGLGVSIIECSVAPNNTDRDKHNKMWPFQNLYLLYCSVCYQNMPSLAAMQYNIYSLLCFLCLYFVFTFTLAYQR